MDAAKCKYDPTKHGLFEFDAAPEKVAQRCPMCGNAPVRRVGCDYCGGKGTVPCPSCRGSGKVFVGNRP